MFDGQSLLITGGTGSFGNAVLKRFLHTDIREVRIFSRDEKKQDDMRRSYQHPKLKFYIGDIRDKKSIASALQGVDYVFHAAALKQVPSCEFHPMEAVKTNVLGTEYVLDAAIAQGVRRVVCLSTDKAVYPINVMGISKALMEKVMVAKARQAQDTGTVICGTRFGNVMASRGSVIPLFLSQLLEGKALTVTDPAMTRFMMTLESAVELVLHAFAHGGNGDTFVQKAPAATIAVLVRALQELLGKEDHPVHHMGPRHSEKLFETLLSREELASAMEQGDYFRIPPDLRDMNYAQPTDAPAGRTVPEHDYNSHNTRRLDVGALKELLLQLAPVRAAHLSARELATA